MMVLVVPLLVPLVDDRIADALDPHIQSAAVERVDFPEALTVNPIRDAIALPRDVVAGIGVHREDACFGGHRRRMAGFNDEPSRFAGTERRLKDQFVDRSVAVVVDGLRYDLIAWRAADADLAWFRRRDARHHVLPRKRDC